MLEFGSSNSSNEPATKTVEPAIAMALTWSSMTPGSQPPSAAPSLARTRARRRWEVLLTVVKDPAMTT